MSESPAPTAHVPTRRPGVVTFIGVILYVQGMMAAVAAASLLLWRDEVLDYLEKEGSPISGNVLNGSVIGEAIVALLLIAVGNGIMRGSSGYRVLVTLAQGISMAFAVYTIIAHHVGGYVYRSAFVLFVGVFVLWALYGNEQSDEYFETNG